MRMGLIVRLGCAAVTLGVTLLVAAPASASPFQKSGTIQGCTWTVSGDDQGDTLTGTVNCPVADNIDAAIAAPGAQANCVPDQDNSGNPKTSGGTVDVQPITFTVAGLSYTYTSDLNFRVPLCPSQAALDASTEANNLQQMAQQFISNAEEQVIYFFLAQNLPTFTGLDPQQQISDLETAVNNAASPSSGAGNTSLDNVGSSASSEDNDQLCPGLNDTQQTTLYVCEPVFVQGDWNAGGKSIVLLPGGGLIAFPVGGNLGNLQAGPTISSSKAIVSLGGIVGGWNVTFKAPKIELTASFVGVLHNLEFDGSKTVWLGKVDITDALGGSSISSAAQTVIGDLGIADNVPEIPSMVSDHLPTSGTVSLPILAEGARVTVNAESDFVLGSNSRIATTALGRVGGLTTVNGGMSPSGETNGYGGSHGGLGGYSGGAPGEFPGLWRKMGGRVPVYDSPFAPSQPGDGGAGFDDNASDGMPGGGVVRIDAHGATAQLDGKVDVAGYDSGINGTNGDHGGSGAGGSVYLTAKTLSGSGEVSADGGGQCSQCGNVAGGSGAGGRIAVVSTQSSGWSGSLHAHGGYDHLYGGLSLGNEGQDWLGTGGAGTVFTQNAVFNASGGVDHGTGTYPDGTLTIDGGRPAGTYPPPDGTPVSDAWNSTKRQLVLSGDALVYGHRMSYGDVVVKDGAVLTTMGDAPFQSLTVTANTLEVQPTGRIDMTGRGAPGGDPIHGGSGGAVSGQTASSPQYGGSYGGAGGASETPDSNHPGHPGSTYGSAQNPVQPGGGGGGDPGGGTVLGNPGGGVVSITTGTLLLNGAISANGESGEGPNALNPAPYDHSGGAGAGGTVLVHAGSLGGTGMISADGGDTCLTNALMLNGVDSSCGAALGGGGGGGRVAVYATNCLWQGKLTATGGVDAQSTNPNNDKGDDGSTSFSSTGTGCSLKFLASLANLLVPNNRTISAILKHSYALVVKGTVPGRLTVSWSSTSTGTHMAARKAKAVLLAIGRANLHRGQRKTITIKLTAAGRRILKHAKRLKVRATARFTPVGQRTVSKARTFVLHR